MICRASSRRASTGRSTPNPSDGERWLSCARTLDDGCDSCTSPRGAAAAAAARSRPPPARGRPIPHSARAPPHRGDRACRRRAPRRTPPRSSPTCRAGSRRALAWIASSWRRCLAGAAGAPWCRALVLCAVLRLCSRRRPGPHWLAAALAPVLGSSVSPAPSPPSRALAGWRRARRLGALGYWWLVSPSCCWLGARG